MATIVTRAGKGSPLTNTEVDANFTNLNTGKEEAANKGVANGYAGLDSTGKIPAAQLPSYVDDVLEYADLASFPGTGETGKIYVALDTNKTYRWSGSAYIFITSGAVDSVAGRTGVVVLVKGDVGLGNVDNTSDATKNSAAVTLTNKTFSLGSNSFSGTKAQFDTACTDADFASLSGSETLTNKTVNLTSNTLSGTKAQFDTACSDDNFAYVGQANTFTQAQTISSGNLNLTGTAQRITGDFSNATVANRVMFQTSTVNGDTSVAAIPNGTGTASQIQARNAADPTNCGVANVKASTTEVSFQANIQGSGTYLPMTFYTGGAERMRIDTSGNVGIGVSPSYRFHVSGLADVAKIASTSTEAGLLMSESGGSTHRIANRGGAFAVDVSSVERLRIDANGNVGIGQDPGNWYGVATRFVAVQNQNGQSNFGIGNSVVGAAAKVAWRMIGGTANSFLDQILGDNNGSPSFWFSYGTAVQYAAFSLGGAERLRIHSSGAFGLGGANYGTAGQVLTSGGSGVAPSWTSPAGLPAGAVAHFAMSTAPSGWLKANGAAVSRTAYAALFAAIGTTYGVGDGSTTFNIPDLRGEFIRGWDDARGVDSGRAFGSAQSSQNLAHNHGGATGAASANPGGLAYGSSYNSQGETFSSAGTSSHAHSISSDGGSEARPRNIALLTCIKY